MSDDYRPSRRPHFATVVLVLLLLGLFAAAALTWWNYDRAEARLLNDEVIESFQTVRPNRD